MMTRKELVENLRAAAGPLYGPDEAASIARLVAEKRYGLTRADIALEPMAAVDEGPGFGTMLSELAAGRPVQYVLGKADFYGLELAVGEGVLIPRPETGELVEWVVRDEKQARTILDVGTGSGAIAIALALNLRGARVTAVDISPDALDFARRNNEAAGSDVTLKTADTLDPSFDPGRFDVIVSNPPYVPASEKESMAINVAGYEPGTALFVPDSDPLVFYRAIARLARRSLEPEGALYFEIHEAMEAPLRNMLAEEGFGEVEVRADINSKPRMARCRN